MCCLEILMLKNRARPRNNLLTQLIIFSEDVISACGSGTYVLWFNFIFGLNFIFPLFWGMVVNDNEFETKGNKIFNQGLIIIIPRESCITSK